MLIITLTNDGWFPELVWILEPKPKTISHWTGTHGKEVWTLSSVTPQSWSPSIVQTGAPSPSVSQSRPAAGAWSCRWPWWPPHRGAGVPATGGAASRDWSTRGPWEGSQIPHNWRHSDGVPRLYACPENLKNVLSKSYPASAAYIGH